MLTVPRTVYSVCMCSIYVPCGNQRLVVRLPCPCRYTFVDVCMHVFSGWMVICTVDHARVLQMDDDVYLMPHRLLLAARQWARMQAGMRLYCRHVLQAS